MKHIKNVSLIIVLFAAILLPKGVHAAGDNFKIKQFDFSKIFSRLQISGNIAETSSMDSPFVSISSPNGGESLKAENTVIITWKAENIKKTDLFKISLVKKDGSLKHLIAEAPYYLRINFFNIPAEIPEGNDYIIKIEICDTEDMKCESAVNDESDGLFSIENKNSLSIKLENPNGGEELKAGFPYEIKWSSNFAMPAKLNIYLYNESLKMPQVPLTIAFLTENDGKEIWTAPYSTTGGKKYKIIIQDSISGLEYDKSDEIFTIIGIGLGKSIVTGR